MKSIQVIASREKALPIAADEITELHAARLLLLLNLCGSKGKISGLTKLAKLDFFSRYPDFFERATAELGNRAAPVTDSKESPMIRHNYGPWDHRYNFFLIWRLAALYRSHNRETPIYLRLHEKEKRCPRPFQGNYRIESFASTC